MLGPAWRVRRTGGLLVPGFTKRFCADGSSGMTYLLRVPIGRFDVVASEASGAVELRYRRWPVVDVLERRPLDGGSIRSAGNVALGARRVRFCGFRLER
jgi:hypothetical protein